DLFFYIEEVISKTSPEVPQVKSKDQRAVRYRSALFLSFIQHDEEKKRVERRSFASIASNLKILIQVETPFFLRKDPFK
ncbi:hypothetical protein, partial [Vibrio parahaemolyticus]|uniref:hypothetical protein n=1 Tax=Vibrio parahaemolyticus TaxID=670 RepID=UPI001C5EDDF1